VILQAEIFLDYREMDYRIIIIALGLVFIIEGIPYFGFPETMKRYLVEILNLPDGTLRIIGFISLLFGLFLVFLGTKVLR
jgi:uncharacterized protein YjeT (DUF2065 family)